MLNLSMQTYRSLAQKWTSSGQASRFLLKSPLSPSFTRAFTSSSQEHLFRKNRYGAYLCAGVLTGVCLQQVHASFKKKIKEERNIKKWVDFNEKLQSQTNGKILSPFEPVEILALKYLKEPAVILDVGCETGKNAACLIKRGHSVVLLDIAPNAIDYTIENLKREGLGHGIQGSVVSKIEDFPGEYGPFKAVVGTYAFSFIPPRLFKQTMEEIVLKNVGEDGYFAGGFFGAQHAWAENKNLSVLSVGDLESLFSSQGFSILEMSEQIKERPTASSGIAQFHIIHVIAHKAKECKF